MAADVQRIQMQCDERKALSESRYQEIRTRLHEFAQKLQANENQISLLERDTEGITSNMQSLKVHIDELDEIIRGGGPNSPGVVELLGRATAGIEEVRQMQEILGRQRQEDGEKQTKLLTSIEVSVDELKLANASRTGEWSFAQKAMAVSLVLLNLAGVCVGAVSLYLHAK